MYIAANLTEDSITRLKNKIAPKHAQVFYHHMTIAYNPDEETLNKYKDLIGTEIELQVFGYCHDARGQAVMVDTDKSENKYPHITLSCAEGESAVYRNTLIEKKTNYGNIYIKLKAIITVNE